MKEQIAQENKGCGGCGGNSDLMSLISIKNPKEKLGKCPTCISISVFGTFIGWTYFMIFNETASGYNGYAKYMFYIACFFSVFLVAHVIAFVVRRILKK